MKAIVLSPRKACALSSFLHAFIPTLLFMFIPIFIPILAVIAGAISDRVGRAKAPEFKVESVRANYVSEPV